MPRFAPSRFSIAVRAVSLTEMPPPGTLQPLDGDAHRLAFMLAWAESEKQKLPRAAEFCTRLIYAPDPDDSLRLPWTLSEQTKSHAESEVLRGYRRTRGVMAVASPLEGRGKSHTAADVSIWFATVHSESGDDMSVSVIQQHMRIHARPSYTAM